ncbi:hypothetical protein SAMN06296952_0200 [Oscillospiraceae bacterium]|nr:hypothetical protein SAMN06296952_0200 [Oscillospiraceae bacterium]
MKKHFDLRKTAAAFMMTVMLFNMTGCSDYLKNIAIKKVTTYVTESINGFFENPEDTLTNKSQAEIVFPELIEQQTELAHNAIGNSAYEITNIKMNDKRNKAVVTLTFEKCPSFSVEDPIGTVDELEDLLEYDDVEMDFNVIRTKDHEWVFEDLNELVKVFYEPFTAPCVLDEDGNPYNINQAYMSMIYVDDFWFDPLMNNPISGSSIRNTDYLKCVVYFNRPMTMECTADLVCNGNVVATTEVVMNGNVTADCHFTSESGNFAPGSYTVILYYNGQEMVVSTAVTVS